MTRRLALAFLLFASPAFAQSSIRGGMAPGGSVTSAAGTLVTSSFASVCTIADTNETTLWTFDLPANALNVDGKGLRITASGTLGATANSKTVRLYFGATVIGTATTTGSGAAGGWRVVGEVQRSSATTQITFAQLVMAAFTNASNASGTAAETLTNAVTIKVTGQNGTAAANDVCAKSVAVETLQSDNGITAGTGGVVANPLIVPNGTAGIPGVSFAGDTTSGIYYVGANSWSGAAAGASIFSVNNNTSKGFQLSSAIPISWSTAGGIPGASDLFVFREAAGVLAQRGTAQMFRVYNSFTDASNYERLDLGWSANVAFIRAANAGTGTGRVLSLDSPAGLQFRIAGTVDWALNSNGHLLTGVDNTFDIGASGATRPRTVYAGTSFLAPDGVAATPSVSFASEATTGFMRPGAGAIDAVSGGTQVVRLSSSGVALLTNAGTITMGSSADTVLARTAAGKVSLTGTTPMLQLGGTTASFPALKQSGTIVQFRLADDSGFAALSASTVNLSAALAGTNPLIFVAAPTISSGFGTSPTIVTPNGPASFILNVGTGGTATAGIIGLPTAATGWNCFVTDSTAAGNHTGLRTYQTSTTTTTATIESQNSAGAATAWASGSLMKVSCFAY